MHINDVLISGADDFLAKYLYRAINDRIATDMQSEQSRVWMLGAGDSAGIRVDIAEKPISMPAAMQVVVHCDGTDVDSVGLDEDTAVARVRNLTASLHDDRPCVFIYVSSVAVYGSRPVEYADEKTPADPDTSYGRAKLAVEKFLQEWCDEAGTVLYILRPAMVVGTGMQGELRRLVNRIYRGTYRHVSGNDARVSVVHASTLADVVAELMYLRDGGIYNVTDGNDPLRHDLAEALAWRLDHKRIYTVPLSKARLLARIGDYIPVTMFTTVGLEKEMASCTFDSHAIFEHTGVKPEAVTDYLRNHIYDESSL